MTQKDLSISSSGLAEYEFSTVDFGDKRLSIFGLLGYGKLFVVVKI